MENPNYSMVELDGPNFTASSSKDGREKNAKQLTWVLLLRAHKATGCLFWNASAAMALASTIRCHVAVGKTDSDTRDENENRTVSWRLYSYINLFLVFSVMLLAFEIAAYFKG
ncbi:hypothetical protein MRB53_010640 [Persea americana]|uniref:Uncharacterized protein n=1 Tax=Persea americana TaxID=3435 RepID=A0ACC2LT48_PERAE|nr:hypothetical protein MRB53_010640 [Persea americana]